MILQSLTDYYRTLADRGEISPPGWGRVKVSYALCIEADGTLEQVISIQTRQEKGKKIVLAPQLLTLPAPVKRSSGVAANFLCDNSSYLLGVDDKGKPKRTLECFQACKVLHQTLLDGVDSPAARAVLAFFQSWRPEEAASPSGSFARSQRDHGWSQPDLSVPWSLCLPGSFGPKRLGSLLPGNRGWA